MNYWPYGQQVKSELALPTTDYPWDSPIEKPEEGEDARSRSPANAAAAAAAAASSGKRMPGMSIAKQPRPTLATWSLPSLFRAYQQALKQQTLAAVALPTEALMKLSEKTSVADLIAPLSQTEANVSGGGGGAGTSSGDLFRRRNRGDSLSTTNLPWTTKIYILVTAGYLLQYSGDGVIDRMPEKVLRLGKSSAAFATDMIPGRHWVLQVSASTEDDGASTTDSRSLLSKLSFRSTEKRYTQHMVMVFESAEDMDDWMTSLRAMIEQLGGRRKLSEVGLPQELEVKNFEVKESGSKEDIASLYLREKKSQGSLIGRDAIRSTRGTPASPPPMLQQDYGRRACDYSIPVIDFDSIGQDLTSDDKSTTNSVASHDGRQLDNLRDSAHRLSLLSSGQRTMLTSTTSSPADSPIRERFPLTLDITAIPETAQPRPNAGAIMSRRVSLQTMGPFVKEVGDGTAEPSQMAPQLWVNTATPPPSEPRGARRFILPPLQQTGHRFLYGKAASAQESGGPPRSPVTVAPRTSLRRLANIRTGRPLSTVEDQPSPKENTMPERPVTSHNGELRSQASSTQVPDVPKLSRGRLMSVPNVPQMFGKLPSGARRLSLLPKREARDASPGPGALPNLQADSAKERHAQRLANFASLQRQQDVASTSVFEADSPLASPTSERSYATMPAPLAGSWADKLKRNRNSREIDGETLRSFSLGFSWSNKPKRTSIASAYSEWSTMGDTRPIETIAETLPQLSPPPTGPLPPTPTRPSSSSSNYGHTIGRKKSIPMMAMPPPAPPPTCALPPIPQKPTARV
ncbi:hypothetical protein HDV57DRAFT_516401 [Trichoderma longibrachiatum]